MPWYNHEGEHTQSYKCRDLETVSLKLCCAMMSLGKGLAGCPRQQPLLAGMPDRAPHGMPMVGMPPVGCICHSAVPGNTQASDFVTEGFGNNRRELS